MGKKAAVAVVSTLAAVTVVGGGIAAAVILTQNNKKTETPVVDANKELDAPAVSTFNEWILGRAWKNANDYIKANHVTVTTVEEDKGLVSWNQYKEGIFNAIANTKIGSEENAPTLRQYLTFDDESFTQNLANITLTINEEMIDSEDGTLKTDSWFEGYITQNGNKISLNNLALSSPYDYFDISFSDKQIVGLSPKGLREKNILIPDGMVSIGENAFYCNTTIENLIIADSVKTLGYGMFDVEPVANRPKSLKLKYVKLSKNLKVVPARCFKECNILEKTDMFEGLQEIGDFSMTNNNYYGDLVFPKTVRKLGNAFIGYNGGNTRSRINSITTWATTFVGDGYFGTFGRNANLKAIYLKGINYNANNVNVFTLNGLEANKDLKVYVENKGVRDMFVKRCITDNTDATSQANKITAEKIIDITAKK